MDSIYFRQKTDHFNPGSFTFRWTVHFRYRPLTPFRPFIFPRLVRTVHTLWTDHIVRCSHCSDNMIRSHCSLFALFAQCGLFAVRWSLVMRNLPNLMIRFYYTLRNNDNFSSRTRVYNWLNNTIFWILGHFKCFFWELFWCSLKHYFYILLTYIFTLNIFELGNIL